MRPSATHARVDDRGESYELVDDRRAATGSHGSAFCVGSRSGRRRPRGAEPTTGVPGTHLHLRRGRRRPRHRLRRRTQSLVRTRGARARRLRDGSQLGSLAEDRHLQFGELWPGSTPSRSASVLRASVNDRSASPCLPQRYRASARIAHRRSRSGSSATRASASMATSRCSPAPSLASSRSSSAVRRSSSRRATSLRAGGRSARSTQGSPRARPGQRGLRGSSGASSATANAPGRGYPRRSSSRESSATNR